VKRLTLHEIIANVIKSLKDRLAANNEKNTLLLDKLDTDPLCNTADERKAIAEEWLNIASSIENLFEKQESQLTNEMRNQLLKLEIEAKHAYLDRAFFENKQDKAIFQTQPCLGMMISLFTRFINADSWFNCHLDEQCQRTLFTLYHFFLTTQQNKVSICQILLVLKNKCDSNFIKVMSLFSLMVESISTIHKNAALSNHIPMRKRVAASEREFEQTFHVYQTHQTSLTGTASIRDQLELAVAHFCAYRYRFMCFDVNSSRKDEIKVFFEREVNALNWFVVVAPYLGVESTRKEVLDHVKIESEMRKVYLTQAFKLFPAARYEEIYFDAHLSTLAWFLVKDALNQLLAWRELIVKILGQQDTDKFSAIDKKNLADYTNGLTCDINAWQHFYTQMVAITSEEYKQRLADNTEEIKKLDQYVQAQEKVKNTVEKTTGVATQVAQHELDEFESLEMAAEKICKEVLAWKQARNGSNDSNRQNREASRVADQAAQQGSPYIPPTQEGLNKEDEEETPLAVSSAPVKSDGLRRLELCDSKLSHLLIRLTRSTQFISSVLRSRVVDKRRIPFETMDRLKTKLNSTLSDLGALKNMRQQFSRLVSSLPKEELNELNESITQSLLYAKEKEEEFEKLLAKTSEMLAPRNGKRKTKKKEGKLAPERRYELGYVAFVKHGRENAKKELSDEALEYKYLRNCQVFYSKELETITKESSTPETVSSHPILVSYPERVQEKWKLVREIPGDHFLFGNVLIDLLRGYTPSSNFGLPSTIDFALTCRTIGEVLDAQNRFHVSKYNSKQARLNLSNFETINVFLTGTLIFTCDGVVGDESGLAQELITGALKDIKEGTLRTIQDAAATLKEHPQTVLVAVFRMSKGFVPDSALYKALFDWQPSDDLKIDYVKVIVAEHLKQLAPDDREEYVLNWNLLGLSKKIFKKDMTLRELERLVLPSAPLLSFFTAKQEAPQAAVGASAERKVVLG
jgi:hypothetical protein